MKQKTIHLWETVEVVLHAKQAYDNPYTDVTVWVDLKGPGFDKRVFGFWDGGDVFKVRVTATAPGLWRYASGASVEDDGLCGERGAFIGIEWSEAEKQENPTRRGMIVPTDNGHAFQYADGAPYIMVGDTWWGLGTYRYPWVDDEQERPIGPDMSIKDMARVRRRQGYNTVGMIAAFPSWANDGYDSTIVMDDEKKTTVRNAWQVDGSPGAGTRGQIRPAKDMHNEGGRSFFFPGKVPGYETVVPDFDRINPDYFKAIDRKMDWLNANGFTVFIEVSRRDLSPAMKNYYDWPMVYTRYAQYIFARYQTNNCLFSPIHYDYRHYAIDSREFNEPNNLLIDLYGHPPFGTLLGTNAAPATLANFGGPDEQHWLTFHQLGNWREHDYYWYLTEMFHAKPTCPSINGEPYYAGHPESFMILDEEGNWTFPDEGLDARSDIDGLYCRSGYYGSILSGALGGILSGYEGGWGANIEEQALYKIWDTLSFEVSEQVKHIQTFLLVEGLRYRDLIPNAELVSPNKTGPAMGYTGWAYCAATEKRDWVLGYAEKDCPKLSVRGLKAYDTYTLTWFDTHEGKWLNAEAKEVQCDSIGCLFLPEFPSATDWAFSLQKN